MSEPTSTPPTAASSADGFRQHLAALRKAVFELHKILIDSERATYEQTVGTIPSPGYFLQLLTTDPWFAWLHPLSQMVVTMDVALDAKKDPLTASAAAVLIQQTRGLLTPSETGEGFARHYYDALQRDPDVLFAHATAMRLARPAKPAV